MCKTPVPSPRSVDGDAGDDPSGHWNKLTLTIGGGSACAYTGKDNRPDTREKKIRSDIKRYQLPTENATEFLCLPEEENLPFRPRISNRNIIYFSLSLKLLRFFTNFILSYIHIHI